MRDLIPQLEQALTDLLLLGLATSGPEMGARLEVLSRQCEHTGLHTGSTLFSELAQAIAQRSHAMEKSDHRAAEAMCRARHYITLCQTRMTEEDIRQRWQQGGST